MISRPPSDGHPRRARWLKIAAAVWLLLISALAIIDRVGQARQAEQMRRAQQTPESKALAAHVADLASQLATLQRQPTPAREADLVAARHALEGRIARIEQDQTDAARASDLQALQARVGAIEASQRAARPVPANTQVPAHRVAASQDAPTPPFRILGVDVRGGVRFLAIAPLTAKSLADAHLLREGNSEGKWQLRAIQGGSARFLVDGRTQSVPLP